MNAYEVEIMPQAEDELLEIGYFIGLNSPKNSLRFINDLVVSFTGALSTSPEIGEVYQGEIRKLTYKKYTAFYRLNALKNGLIFCILSVWLSRCLCEILSFKLSWQARFFAYLNVFCLTSELSINVYWSKNCELS